MPHRWTHQKPGTERDASGMHGITSEFELLTKRLPTVLTYPLAKPGGEAARLVGFCTRNYARTVVSESNVYPVLFRKVIDDLRIRLHR